MPSTLHPHLKRRLEYNDILVNPEDTVEGGTYHHGDSEEQAAKQRRVEKIALQYLQGKRPVMLSAGLRGPFGNGWKNPWTSAKKATRKPSKSGSGMGSHGASISGKDVVSKVGSTVAAKRTRSAVHKSRREQTVASPETCRAAGGNLEDIRESHTLERVEISPATAMTKEHATAISQVSQTQGRMAPPPMTASPEYRAKNASITPTSTSMLMPTPAAVHKITSTNPAHQSIPAITNDSSCNTLQQDIKEQHTQELNFFSPEHSVVALPVVSPLRCPSNHESQEVMQAEKQVEPPHHDPITSPPPQSSAGFEFRKVRGTKWTISNAPRSKPRAVNFNSSPTNKENVTKACKPSTQNKDTMAEGASLEASLAGADVSSDEETRDSQAQEFVQKQHSVDRRQSGGQSTMSTQAAMLLAQLEFQESTFPTSSTETLQPWSRSQEETPRSRFPELSPAITPLSVFRTGLEPTLSLPSALRDRPVSTQDLFAAASPFALSTAKKPSRGPQHSNLRTATTFGGEHDGTEDTFSRSPLSPADKTPLKEKHTVPNPWRLAMETGSRASQTSSKGNDGQSISPIQSPHSDFHPSLTEPGPNGPSHFTDRLLGKFNDT